MGRVSAEIPLSCRVRASRFVRLSPVYLQRAVMCALAGARLPVPSASIMCPLREGGVFLCFEAARVTLVDLGVCPCVSRGP